MLVQRNQNMLLSCGWPSHTCVQRTAPAVDSPCWWPTHVRTPGNRPGFHHRRRGVGVSDPLAVSPQNIIFPSPTATYSSLHGEVTIHLPEVIIMVPVLAFALLKDSRGSFSSFLCPPPKTAGWMTRFIGTVLMIRKAWTYRFQIVSYIVNTRQREKRGGGNTREKVLCIHKFSLSWNFPKYLPGHLASLLPFPLSLSFCLIVSVGEGEYMERKLNVPHMVSTSTS